jgi:hypothetical protein
MKSYQQNRRKNVGDLILSFTRRAYRVCNNKLNPYFASPNEYVFINRQGGGENLLIILAGYQPYYFDAVFERVERCRKQFGEHLDVCVCCSSAPLEATKMLEKICERHHYSLLYFRKNRVTQIQNTAIKLHPNATWIYKMDEDIILSDNYFAKMKDAYKEAEASLPYKVGFAGPVLNINAFGTQSFLKAIGKWDEFERKFGRFLVGGMINTPQDDIHRNQEWAQYIWEQSIPFDDVAAKVAQNKQIEICPIRFSIGAVLFKREFLDRNGYFPVYREGGMGTDEKHMCDICMEAMYSIVVPSNILVGHLGFGPQKETCKKFYQEHEKEIRLANVD